MEAIASRACGIHAARLNLADYAVNFSDSHAPLTRPQALIEAERCYYCHDAPCATACPTGIDIPSFIHRIAQDNHRGAARAILEANPLGGMCARVCPTEVLCEQACVRNTNEDKPVEIGALQRYATDALFHAPGAPLFTRAAPTGKRVAVVGAGPAGLACAHGLAMRGHDVALFDARPKLGGLNEYGLASYKTTNGFAQQEIDWLLSIGGISVRCNQRLGRDITLDGLLAAHDAVFLGLGLAGVNAIGIAEPQATGLRNAVDFIAELRQATDLSAVPVGRRVVVIGGGMTAVDAAVQARKLGAEEVTIAYRRGASAMSASEVEQRWAQTHGVTIRHWAAPKEILCENGQVQGVRFAATEPQGGGIAETGEHFVLAADMVLKAIGQTYVAAPARAAIALQG
ncbi:MAG: NAD(P)-dependent oxidoreductase, partial [Burkholderiaceae bacterium]